MSTIFNTISIDYYHLWQPPRWQVDAIIWTSTPPPK